ncbi:MAG: sulfatase-like hydrolase/transferase [Rariglobus sp.]
MGYFGWRVRRERLHGRCGFGVIVGMSSERPPNILWIVTTQWRAQACGYAGDVNARTPHLDALAARSVNYAQAVTPHPFGPFARAALMTGVRSPENGVRDYYDPLPLNARTIAHDMNDRGYKTAFFGKWHLAERDPAAALVGETHARMIVPPEARGGFEFWEGFEGGFLLNDPWLHGSRLREPVKFEGYQAEVLADRAEEWWISGGRDDRPWFAVVSLESPHPPYAARAGGIDTYDPEKLVLRNNVTDDLVLRKKARDELAGYYAHIEATDKCVGLLLSNLRLGEKGGPDIVVFTSVHGDMHGAHGLFRKGWPHEESVRVPLLVHGAPGSTPGYRSDDVVSLIDLPAMTRAWADGRSWRCEHDRAEISMPSVVALPHQCDRVWSGWRSPTRKEIFNADASPWLAFDLAEDPFEERPL